MQKPHNVLVDSDCLTKICDFGLSRGFESFDELATPVMSTFYLATRWYRPPEMLLESNVATVEGDLWSCGCIMFELLSRDVLFKGRNRVHQLEVVVDMLGIPDNLNELNGSEPAKKYLAEHYKPKPSPSLRDRLPHNVDPVAFDLLEKLIVFDPAKRLTVDEALAHPFFAMIRNPALEARAEAPMDFSFERELQMELHKLQQTGRIDQNGMTDSDVIKRMLYREITEWNAIT